MDNFEKEVLIALNSRIQDMLDGFREDLIQDTTYLIGNAYCHKYFAEFQINVWNSMKEHCKEFYKKLDELEKWGKS